MNHPSDLYQPALLHWSTTCFTHFSFSLTNSDALKTIPNSHEKKHGFFQQLLNELDSCGEKVLPACLNALASTIMSAMLLLYTSALLQEHSELHRCLLSSSWLKLKLISGPVRHKIHRKSGNVLEILQTFPLTLNYTAMYNSGKTKFSKKLFYSKYSIYL